MSAQQRKTETKSSELAVQEEAILEEEGAILVDSLCENEQSKLEQVKAKRKAVCEANPTHTLAHGRR